MKTDKLIEFFKANLPRDMMSDDHIWVDEIVQKLREHDELKKLVHATIEPLQFLFEFAVSVLDDDDEGNPNWAVEEEESE